MEKMARSNLDGCGQFMKYSLFIVNFLIFLGGIAVLALGIWALSDAASVSKVMGDNLYKASSGLLIAFGGIVAFISFLGCCGAIKEVKCLLGTFFVIMLLLAILIALGAIFAFVVKDALNEKLPGALKESIKEIDGTGKDSSALLDSWNEIQKQFKCCGVDGPDDWSLSPQYLSTRPDGCCVKEGCNLPNTGDKKYFQEGCVKKVEKYIADHMKPLGIVGIILAVIIVLSMVFSCALCLMV